ncbi:hypothetical protein Tco_0458980 [Tanacetum coccineum]
MIHTISRASVKELDPARGPEKEKAILEESRMWTRAQFMGIPEHRQLRPVLYEMKSTTTGLDSHHKPTRDVFENSSQASSLRTNRLDIMYNT